MAGDLRDQLAADKRARDYLSRTTPRRGLIFPDLSLTTSQASGFYGNVSLQAEYCETRSHRRETDRLTRIHKLRAGERLLNDTFSVADVDRYLAGASYFGIPKCLVVMEDLIAEMLEPETRDWPTRFARAIPLGANLDVVWPRMALWMIDNVPSINVVSATRVTPDNVMADAKTFFQEWQASGRIPLTSRLSLSRIKQARTQWHELRSSITMEARKKAESYFHDIATEVLQLAHSASTLASDSLATVDRYGPFPERWSRNVNGTRTVAADLAQHWSLCVGRLLVSISRTDWLVDWFQASARDMMMNEAPYLWQEPQRSEERAKDARAHTDQARLAFMDECNAVRDALWAFESAWHAHAIATSWSISDGIRVRLASSVVARAIRGPHVHVPTGAESLGIDARHGARRRLADQLIGLCAQPRIK